MFIDVVQLSVYFTHLSPKQILGTLSDLWSSYNRKIGEYKYMNKIKLIGDIYMCAAVLYRNEPDPKADAIYSRNH
ncbi:hypothetical protein TRFO_32272 [Tritrichomonas foetus]|uniref:Guanylate cyclase domain-containing protein n=1 Tax=Tritrichomonas foetus TaxID=1144522 RepID=A0A1J4JQ99_9EUKA|nr:hypothetical protein TRFO_32272 [Tritrichomonas foetus]|eukprot:OHT00922.1 hypothetical protein TRFO_32272 [Tritrichomonas foetus]